MQGVVRVAGHVQRFLALQPMPQNDCLMRCAWPNVLLLASRRHNDAMVEAPPRYPNLLRGALSEILNVDSRRLSRLPRPVGSSKHWRNTPRASRGGTTTPAGRPPALRAVMRPAPTAPAAPAAPALRPRNRGSQCPRPFPASQGHEARHQRCHASCWGNPTRNRGRQC